jgi:hypothetical protein
MSLNDKENIIHSPNESSHYIYCDSDQDEIDKDKKAVWKKLRKLIPDQEDIESTAKGLKQNIFGLDTKIHNILTKHHNDYITTFNEFMDTVRKDLKQKIEQMERVEKEKRKNENIHLIIAERDFFRQEAIRLNQLCKELSFKVDETTRELKFQTHELGSLSKKWKESENTNKQLIVELERNIQNNKELENQLKLVQQEQFINNNNIMPQENIPEEMFENPELMLSKEKLIRIVEKLKFEVKKERIRNHKILGEFNKIMLDKNKLEKIFIDCVEESRKEILNRRIKDQLTTRSNFHSANLLKNKSGNVSIPYINDVKYENFLPSDKKKLIENFILKEEVVNVIKDHIFKKMETNFEGKGDFSQTRSSFMKTDNKIFSISHRRKTPSTGFTFTMPIRGKTPGMNYL